MWKQSGRSSALERAQAVLSSRRGRAGPAATAHHAPRMSQGSAVRAPPARMSSDLLSDLSGSESSLSPGPGQDHRAGAPVPNQSSDCGLEVSPPLIPLDSGANRFLKRPAAAQDQAKERAVPCSRRGSQTAALSRLAQIENRFGKTLHTKGSSRAEQTAVQELTEETPHTDQPRTDQPRADQPRADQPRTDQPRTDQSRGFEKRPPGAHGRYSAESNSRWQLHTEDPPVPPENTWLVQPQSSPSPCSMSPSPPCLPPSAPHSPPSPPCLSSVGSACGEVHSLEELLPLEAASEDDHSDGSDSSGCFRLNLMDLDELAPALLLEEHSDAQEPEVQEMHEEEVEETVHEEEVEEVQEEVEEVQEEVEEVQEEEEVHEEEEVEEEVHEGDYSSDFESDLQTEDLSEHSRDSGQPPSPRSSYSDTFTRATPPSAPCTPEPPPHSHGPLSQPDTTSAGFPSHLPAAWSSCPSLELLMQSLRQQLDLTSHFISNAQEQRTRLLEGLGPPSYRYTTLQDTLQYISRLGASRSPSDQQMERR